MGRYIHENTVGADAVATTHVGFAAEAFPSHVSKAVAVVVEQVGGADAQWNVLLDGKNLFDAGGGVNVNAANTPELFVPNAGNRANLITANENAPIEVEIKTAGTGDLHVTVLTDDNRED